MATFTIDLFRGDQYLFNGNFTSGGTGNLTLNNVIHNGPITNLEPTFNGGIIVNTIRPSGDSINAIKINKADGITSIININTISGLTGFGTIAPTNKIHLYGTDNTSVGEYSVQTNGITLDGNNDTDKEILWVSCGVPKWQAQTYRCENGAFWYLVSTEALNNPLTVKNSGVLGINKQSNYLNYHTGLIVGDGLNDLVVSGVYTESYNTVYNIEIVGTGGSDDTYHWKKSLDNGISFGVWSPISGVTLTPVGLEYGVNINFENLTGHTAGNIFEFAGFTQIPQATLSIAPMGIQEVLQSLDFSASPIEYNDITAIANGGVYQSRFMIFNTGVTGTQEALYWGVTVEINSVFINLTTIGESIILITEYWNGHSWVVLDDILHGYLDGTDNLTKSGRLNWSANRLNWVKSYIPDMNEPGYELYWMRIRTSTNPTKAPTAQSISIGNDKRFSIYDAFNDFKPSYYIDSLGRVNVGGGNITGSNKLQVNTGNNVQVTTTGTDSLVELDSENSAVIDLKIKLASNDSCPPGLTFVKTRGTLDSSSCTQQGDILGAIKFRGRAGTSGRLLSEIGSQFAGTGTTRCGDIYFNTANGSDPIERIRIAHDGNVGLGITSPVAYLHIKSGSTTTPPLKFTAGNLLNSPQVGAVEFDGYKFYFTITGSTIRKTFSPLESPIFTGNPELPVGTTLNSVSLTNYILNSGGTDNSNKLNTIIFNAYTGTSAPILNTTVTGSTNGLTKSTRNIKLGGNLTENTIITGCSFNFTLGSNIINLCAVNNINIGSRACNINIRGYNSTGVEKTNFILSDTQAIFNDSRTVPLGIQYNGDYSSTYNSRSLVDKGYVDTHAGGIFPKAAVNVATTGNIGLSGLTTVDGIVLKANNRVLAKDQISGKTNGVYVASSGVWSRAIDFDQTSEVVNGSYFFIYSGNTNENSSWILTTPNPITVGTDSLTFAIFSSTSGVGEGNGICVTQGGGNYNVAIKLPTNCGLCTTASGLFVNPSIAGTGLNYTTGVLSVCGSNLAGNSITWTGNTFNVNIASGTLCSALNSKLNVLSFNSYSSTTLNNINCRLLTTIYSNYTGVTAPNAYLAKLIFNTYTGTTAPNTYVTKTQYNSYTGTTSSIITNKADLSGATFTGIIRVPKPSQNDNTTCVATTSWYISQGGTASPLMDSVAACGSSNLFSRQDHTHPSDTSRLTVSLFNSYSGTTIPNTYYNKTQINSYTGKTKTTLDQKAFLSGATFTGVVNVPKPAQNNNTTCVATTSWYISQGGTANPLINAVAASGTSNLFSRQDHVHPIDTTRLAVILFNTYSGTTVPNTYYNKTQINNYTGVTVPNTYYNKTQINSYTGTTNTAITNRLLTTIYSNYTGTTAPNTFAPKANPTFTGTVTIPTPFTLGAISVKTTGTELNYVTGATSNIQTQINTKVNKAGDTMTGALRINSNLTVTGNTYHSGSTYLKTVNVGDFISGHTLYWNPNTRVVSAIHLTGGSDTYFYTDKTTVATLTSGSAIYLSGTPWTFKAGRYQVDFSTQYGNNNTNGTTCAWFAIDGAVIGSCYLNGAMGSAWMSSASLSRDVTLTAGCHCLAICYARGSNTACVCYGSIRAIRIC